MSKTEQWFFLRGLVRETGHWAGFLEKFAHTFPQYEVHTLDLPGCGIHHDKKSPTSIPKMVDFLREDFLSQKSSLPTNIFAVSLGAMVSLNWMQRYPDDWSKAILANTSLRGFSPFYHRLQPKNYLTILKLFFSSDLAYREEKILEMTSIRKEIFPTLSKEWALLQKKHPVSSMNALRQLWAATRFRPSLQKPRPPIALLNSKEDQLVSHLCSERIAKAWQLPCLVHPEAGHDITLDAAEWVLEKIENI